MFGDTFLLVFLYGIFPVTGLFCVFLVAGYLLKQRPFRFAVSGMVVIIAAVFVCSVVGMLWRWLAPQKVAQKVDSGNGIEIEGLHSH